MKKKANIVFRDYTALQMFTRSLDNQRLRHQVEDAGDWIQSSTYLLVNFKQTTPVLGARGDDTTFKPPSCPATAADGPTTTYSQELRLYSIRRSIRHGLLVGCRVMLLYGNACCL